MSFTFTDIIYLGTATPGSGGGGGGGSDPHNLGYYADLTALQTAHPTGTDGDFAILGSTDTIWVWDSGTSAWKDTDTKGQVTSVNGQTGAVTVDTLPSQTGNSGKFLTTDGTDASWATINALQNVATGTDSISILGPVATANYCINMGLYSGAKQVGCTAIGIAANAGGTSSLDTNASAYGMYSSASKSASVAVGYQAVAEAAGAAQIGTGTNSTANTLQFKSYPIVNSDGTIPTDRFTTTPVADGTYVPTLTISSGVATRSWAAPSGGGSTALSLTLAAANWSNNSITVTATGVTASNNVIVSPAPASQSAYTTAGVMCTAQATDSLTFTCTTTPSSDLTVTVLII